MPVIKLTEEVQEAFSDEASEEVGFELVEEGDWVSEGKYDRKEYIYKNLETGKFYVYYTSRWGSYFSDYEYETPEELVEVTPVETTTVIYKVVK